MEKIQDKKELRCLTLIHSFGFFLSFSLFSEHGLGTFGVTVSWEHGGRGEYHNVDRGRHLEMCAFFNSD